MKHTGWVWAVVGLLSAGPGAFAQEQWDPDAFNGKAVKGERVELVQKHRTTISLGGTEGSEEVEISWKVTSTITVTGATKDGDVTAASVAFTKFELEARDGEESLTDSRLAGETVTFARKKDGTFSWKLSDQKKAESDDAIDEKADFLRFFLYEMCNTFDRFNNLDTQFDPPAPVGKGNTWKLGMPAAKHLRLNEANVDLEKSDGKGTLKALAKGRFALRVDGRIQTKGVPVDDLLELSYLSDSLEELSILGKAGKWANGGQAGIRVDLDLPCSGDGVWKESAEVKLTGTLRVESATITYHQVTAWKDTYTPLN